MEVKCPKCRYRYDTPVASGENEVACVCPRCGVPFTLSMTVKYKMQEGGEVPSNAAEKPWMQDELVQFIKKNGYHKLNGKEGKILWMEMGDNGWKMFRKDDIWKTLATRGLMVDVLVKFDDCYEESRFYLEQDFKGGDEGNDGSYGPLYISRKWKKLPDPLYR